MNLDFSNIVILGPTSSGKTNLANTIASIKNINIFSCDSVQIYKDLNLLTNKPNFVKQELVDDEVVSTIQIDTKLDLSSYDGFDFEILIRKNGKVSNKTLNSEEFKKAFLMQDNLDEVVGSKVNNYLFDIRRPLESYSIAEFSNDIKRIESKNPHQKSKVIVGGTIYYAYHYLKGTSLEELELDLAVLDEVSNTELIRFLEVNDPGSLTLVENLTRQRLTKAVAYFKQTGKRFSQQYYKASEWIDDTLIIMLFPKDREVYCSKLDYIVETRMNNEALNEIRKLESKYGEEVTPWLSKVSYEYRYAVLLKDKGFKKKLVEELKAKERQYTKRQVTFMRKLKSEFIASK